MVAIIALVVALVVWLFNRDNDDSSTPTASGECISGDLSLPVGGHSTAAQKLVDSFNESAPISRDFCVKAKSVGGDVPAATYLFAGSRPDAATALAETGAVANSSEDSWPQVDAAQAGLAVAEGTDPATLTLDQVALPVATNSGVSAAIALALAPNEEDAAAALERNADVTATGAAQSPAFATVEGTELPEGYTFEAIDGAEVPVWAIATNAGNDISEDQARAASDFSNFDFQAGTADNAALENVLSQAQEIAAVETTEEVPPVEEETVVASPSDTIINLDTSSNMDRVVDGTQESYHTVVTRSLANLARETGGLGNQVALNNYSSPLNPGVTKGWRANISFPNSSQGENAAGAVVRLGTGGVPLTRASVVAATQIAKEGSPDGQPMRVVIVTSGSAGEYSDEAFLNDLSTAFADNISLHIVHVGHDSQDSVLSEFATSHNGTSTQASTIEQIDAALREAFGL
ncbi:hypothetical protein [Corynebacterium crudilactis]|uniref:VWFA domain-containing protein n=1 Tax=Corynebacterium crudilactis TaxID=1652495 RepID=A0A172QTE4_9CORY|nr:hypothetical protein [Corynebacterium crudilactis]ANE03979.1 hypothetical protein ccrud_06995 [Corynebacterium crudilactis]